MFGHWTNQLGHRMHCGGRHGRRFGFGPAMGTPDDRHMGWDDLRAGRKLSGGHLQLLLLALLAEKPAHGYELIKALEERSGGFYSPSPGMIYPALTYLEEVGYASVDVDANKKRYTINDAGRAYLREHRGTVDTLLAQLRWMSDKLEHVRRAFSRHAEDADDAPHVL
jgi:DNA-binding PadR family transcriptional regulator